MGFVEGGARCFMASYNAWNKVPMTVNPIIPNVVIPEWGVNGVICTDAGSLDNMISARAHHYYPNRPRGCRRDQGRHQPVPGQHLRNRHPQRAEQ